MVQWFRRVQLKLTMLSSFNFTKITKPPKKSTKPLRKLIFPGHIIFPWTPNPVETWTLIGHDIDSSRDMVTK